MSRFPAFFFLPRACAPFSWSSGITRSDLYQAIHAFLLIEGLKASAKALKKEAALAVDGDRAAGEQLKKAFGVVDVVDEENDTSSESDSSDSESGESHRWF